MRRVFFFLVTACLTSASSATADDYQEPTGYETSEPSYQLDVAHDGYGGAGRPMDSVEPRAYPVLEAAAEAGTTVEVEGESVLVVTEPSPLAATKQAPPAPKVAPSDEQAKDCPAGVWVHGYWDYRSGHYAWVEGHCVEVRVNYVFVHPRWDFYWDIWWFIPGYYRPCGAYVGFGYYRPWHWFPPYALPYYRTGRAVPVFRGTPIRPTVARPATAPRVPSASRIPKPSTTVIQTTPSEVTRSTSLGRAGTGPVLTREGMRSPARVDIVTQPRLNPSRSSGLGGPSQRGSRGLGGSSRARPSSSGSGWQPSSGSSSRSSRGWTGDRTRSTPSTGRSSRGSSSGQQGGGFGGKRSK
ncbi:MAG: hypothetical protein JRE81_12330 [Deltaproteobacteria bacterium]|nr:hypothetical protein [Deltaproteobacteria bacterium]